jgi:leader peptidase (prepilin peptidase)/N-methyltransferase
MGLGDVKMLAMVGAFLGAPRVVLTMLLGSVIGTIVVVPLVLAGRRGMKTPVAFGPFLGLAAVIVMLWGSRILEWYGALVFVGGD